jgi:predicted nucleic acid-binding protein
VSGGAHQSATHAYVFEETVALVSRRLGREAVAQLIDGVTTVVSVSPVDSRLHQAAVRTYRNSGWSAVSFADQTSLEFMRSNRLVEAFTFDSDYVSAGIALAS